MMEKYKLNDKSSVKVHNHTVIQFSMIPSIMKTDPPIRNSPILNMSSSPETSHLPENDKLKNLPCKVFFMILQGSKELFNCFFVRYIIP